MVFADEANIGLLRSTMHEAQKLYPFTMHAYAFMPDHLHLLILVPPETNISKLTHSIQWNYTRNYKDAHQITTSLHLWQRGFWDHVIRDDQDFEGHFNYIHYNPVKHGYVHSPADYAHSSFRHYVQRGWYGQTWAWNGAPAALPGEDPSDLTGRRTWRATVGESDCRRH